MYVVFCKIDHCIHIHWCIIMGLGHNDPWVESHMWPQQTWGQRSSRGQWPLVQVFGKKGQCIHILWCIFKSNILQWLQKYVIAKAGETRGSRTALFCKMPRHVEKLGSVHTKCQYQVTVFGYRSCVRVARLRSFISSVILPSSLSYVPCTVLKFRALDRFPGINVPGIFYSRNFLNWVLTALFHPLANV